MLQICNGVLTSGTMSETLVVRFNPPKLFSCALQFFPLPKSDGSLRPLNLRNAVFKSSIAVGVQKPVPTSSRFVCRLKWREEENEEFVKGLRVPEEWMVPSAALRESEWLRVALQKWLDDEYCPEIANEEISKRCARVYYYCLMEKQADMGEILMQMVRDLETFSFKESFHGAFSSANAAVHLITMKIQATEDAQNK